MSEWDITTEPDNFLVRSWNGRVLIHNTPSTMTIHIPDNEEIAV